MKHITMGEIHKFQCIGSQCPYTCCANWGTIDIDPQTVQYYQSVEGALGEELKENVDWNAKPVKFKMRDRRCPFLNEENLCRIYMELGPEHMCVTCKEYPRFKQTSGDIVFHHLTFSCPEATRIFLTRRRPIEFHVMETEDAPRQNNMEEADWRFFRLAERAFWVSVNILQNRSYSVSKRERALLIFHRSLQDALDAGRNDEVEALLQYFSSPEHYSALLNGERPIQLASKVRLFRTLCEPFLKKPFGSESFQLFLKTALYLQSGQADMDAISRYLETLDGKDFQREQESLLVYLLFNHYLSNDLLDKGANRNLFRRVVFVLTVFQLYRIFAAVISAWREETVNSDNRFMIISFLSRYFEHATGNFFQFFMDFNHALEENQFYDTGFLFELIS